jgi:phosphomannomutase
VRGWEDDDPMTKMVSIRELMDSSGVKFGTSGARGLVSAMTDEVCFAYTAAFLQYLRAEGLIAPGAAIAFAGDLRPSTGRIVDAVASAVIHHGYRPIDCGRTPSPAVALYGLEQSIASIMVTGSHIPDDRNGIKFNTPAGEILKRDEVGMTAQVVALPDLFDARGALRDAAPARALEPLATRRYVARYLDVYPRDLLRGRRIGVYEHSAVGRDLLVEIYAGLGAEVVRLARSERFVPVDTEAIRAEDHAAALAWTAEHALDSIVSTDGDSDRPLLSDERGLWIRGDVAGILCARELGADAVVVPVSCNTAVERLGAFAEVSRTRIGSPFVIEEMFAAVARGRRCVVGYEANGGFLTASPIELPGGVLAPLPTRDPIIVQLSVLAAAVRGACPLSALTNALPHRFTHSDRLVNFPSETSRKRLDEIAERGVAGVVDALGRQFGEAVSVNTIDGVRATFASSEIVHLRASGNAPELRCYAEAATEARAKELCELALATASAWRGTATTG